MKEHEQIFSKILNAEQVLTSDTIRIVDEFSTVPQEIYKTVSFTIIDSSLNANNKTYLPFKFNHNNDKKNYIAFVNGTLFLFDLKEEYVLLILNAKIGKSWEVKKNEFMHELQISKVESFRNNEINDSVFVFSVQENPPHIPDTPRLTLIHFSKKYGFLKFVYTLKFMNNKTLVCYNRKNRNP